MNNALSQILWYSFPIVYPDYYKDTKTARLKLEAVKARRKRYRKYVRSMLGTFKDKPAYLVSLTFTDECLNSTKAETRERYVKDYLNQVSVDYFACIDFGKVDKREHYHAIIVTDEPTYSFKPKRQEFWKFLDDKAEWKHGFYSLRLMYSAEKDIYKTMNYALKASDYAFKSADEDKRIKPFHKRGVKHIENPLVWELPFQAITLKNGSSCKVTFGEVFFCFQVLTFLLVSVIL